MSVEMIPTPLVFQEKVRNGVSWLNERAPRGWIYNFFGDVNGEHIFSMSLLSAENSVLPLAFKGERLTTHMSHCGIAHHFKLDVDAQMELGFHAGSIKHVTAFEKAWEQVLREKIKEDEFFTEDGSLR